MTQRKLQTISEWFSAVEFLILRAAVFILFLYGLWKFLSHS
jgi:hypothetical protein